MLSRCTLAHRFATVPKALEALSSSRPFNNTALLRTSLSTQSNSLRPDLIFSDQPNWPNDTPQRTSRPPRQAMTARESNAFNEMFSMIFDAATAHENNYPAGDAIVGFGRDGIDDLIGKLRKYPKRLKWSTELDDILDRQKEVINLFTTDQELLEWATDAVFGESQRYEEAARKAITEAGASGTKAELPMLQPPTYPHLVALIMEAFRDKFNDPHLAISMFEHARNLSIASYVFGCSSQAYHQLIETRWKCFQDLKGVHDALQEMRVNGVTVSSQTQRLVEKLRREVGEKHVWVEESEIGSGEVWNVLAQIEKIALSGRKPASLRDDKRKPISANVKWDDWKAADSQGEKDDWGFNQWHSRSTTGSNTEKGEVEFDETGDRVDWDLGFNEWGSRPRKMEKNALNRRPPRRGKSFGLAIPDDAGTSSCDTAKLSEDAEEWGLDQAVKHIERLEKVLTPKSRRQRFGLTDSRQDEEWV